MSRTSSIFQAMSRNLRTNMSLSSSTYSKIWLSDFFHDFPHINFHFSSVNSTFDPEKRDYQEAIGFWGLLPVAVCFVLWLVFLFYFIFRCCQSSTRLQQRASSCPIIFTGLLIVVGVGLMGYGFFENERAHESVESVKRAVLDANSTIMESSATVDTLKDISEIVSTTDCNNIESALDGVPPSERAKVMKYINQIRVDGKSVIRYMDQIDVNYDKDGFKEAVSIASDAEFYRWLATVLVYCIFVLLFLLSFIGLLLKSKNLLIVVTVLFLICSLFVWLGTGTYASVSIGLGDLCVDPDSYFLSLAHDTSFQKAVTAYIVCTDTRQPYAEDIQKAMSAITEATDQLNKVVEEAKKFSLEKLAAPVKVMQTDLEFASGNLSLLLNNVGVCTSLHQDYTEAVQAACVDTLQSVAILCLVCVLEAVLCTVIILFLSCVLRGYKHCRRPQAHYVTVDDSDPFLPKPPDYEDRGEYGAIGHSSPRPWSERGSLQRSSGQPTAEDEMMLPRQPPVPGDESPPPAYHPGHYMRPYSEDDGPVAFR